MFARLVSMQLKPNSIPDFTRAIEQEILPLLRRNKGFRDELTLVVPGGTEGIGISLWDSREDAEAYNRQTYPEVLKVLSKVVEGTPLVRTFEVGNSTFHKLAAGAAAR